MNYSVRFVEAGFDAMGESAILHTRHVEKTLPTPEIPSLSITTLYYVEEYPLTTKTQHREVPYDINLQPQALWFLICRIPPITQIIQEWNNPQIQSAQDFIQVGMHRTPSVDYFYVSKGAVTLYMGNSATHEFQAGNACAMRGADHAWVNYGKEECELVGVMLGVSQ